MRTVGIVLMIVAVIELILAVELVSDATVVDPRYRLFLASWLETELWVDLRLLGAGLVTFAAALALLATARRAPDTA